MCIGAREEALIQAPTSDKREEKRNMLTICMYGWMRVCARASVLASVFMCNICKTFFI